MDQRALAEKRSREDVDSTAPKNPTKATPGSQSVCVTNLPPNYSHKDLLMFASEFGEVESKTFSLLNASIVFANKNAAFRMKKTKKLFGGYRLGIDFLRTRSNTPDKQRKKKNPRRYQQGHLVAPLDHDSITEKLDDKMTFDQELKTLRSQLLPSDPTLSYPRVIHDLHHVLSPMLSGYYDILPFGSTVSGLAFKGSDIDLLVDWKATMYRYNSNMTGDRPVFERSVDDMWLMKDVNALMLKRPQCFQNVFFIKSAKVPILKFKHVATQVNCDLSFKNVLAVQNSLLIKFYTTLDKRVKPLLFIIKYWAKYFAIVRPGWFNNYALTMMVLFYLQQLDKPIVPPVYVLQTACSKKMYVDDWECSFESYRCNIGPPSNKSPLPTLLQGFFEFFATFNFETMMICPLLGKSMPKCVLQDLTQLPPEMAQFKNHPLNKDFRLDCAMFVQDPFILNMNITRAIQKGSLLAFQNACLASLYVFSARTVSATSTGLLKLLLRRRTIDLARFPTLLQCQPAKGTGLESPFLKVLEKINARSQSSTKTSSTNTKGAANGIASTTSAHKTSTTSTRNIETTVTPITSVAHTATAITSTSSPLNMHNTNVPGANEHAV